MTSTLLKYNVILIVLCFGMTLIDFSSQNDPDVKEESEKIILYYDPISPPCRFILFALKALDIQLEKEEIKLLQKEHLQETFTEINPLQTVPVLKISTDTHIFTESIAIVQYLAEKFNKAGNTLVFRKELKTRALMNNFLIFNTTALYQSFRNQYNAWVFDGVEPTVKRELAIHKNLTAVENNVMRDNHWLFGDEISVADFALYTSISTFQVYQVYLNDYPKLLKWFENCKKEIDNNYQELNDNESLDKIAKMLKGKDFENKSKTFRETIIKELSSNNVGTNENTE